MFNIVQVKDYIQVNSDFNISLLKTERIPYLAIADGLRGALEEHAGEGPRRGKLQPSHIRIVAHQVHGESR